MVHDALIIPHRAFPGFVAMAFVIGCAPADDAPTPSAAPVIDAAMAVDVFMDEDAAQEDAEVPDLGPSPEPLDPALKFAFPIHPEDRPLIHPTIVFGVDHDPEMGNRVACLNYAEQPFPFCYDEHDGSDFILTDGFAEMDRGSARVVAAAAGEVYRVVDGNYDRCFGDINLGDINCDGHPMRANHVRIRHANGWTTWYYHFKRDSIVVEVGDFVGCGDVLGLVGSSGRSFLPHLHFEVEDESGQNVDPFAGTLREGDSHWMQQMGPDLLPGPDCHPLWTDP